MTKVRLPLAIEHNPQYSRISVLSGDILIEETAGSPHNPGSLSCLIDGNCLVPRRLKNVTTLRCSLDNCSTEVMIQPAIIK